MSWFPRYHQETGRIVSGNVTIHLDGVPLGGPGTSPMWLNRREVIYTAQPLGETMLLDVETLQAKLIRSPGANQLAAGGGRIAGWPWQPWRAPTLSPDGRLAGLADVGDHSALMVENLDGVPIKIDEGHLFTPRWVGSFGVLYTHATLGHTRTFFWDARTGSLADVSAEDAQFNPVGVFVGNTLWVVAHTHSRLLLYKSSAPGWGYVLATGETHNPDVCYVEGDVRVCWYDPPAGALRQRLINVERDPMVRLSEVSMNPEVSIFGYTAVGVAPFTVGMAYAAKGVTSARKRVRVVGAEEWLTEYIPVTDTGFTTFELREPGQYQISVYGRYGFADHEFVETSRQRIVTVLAPTVSAPPPVTSQFVQELVHTVEKVAAGLGDLSTLVRQQLGDEAVARAMTALAAGHPTSHALSVARQYLQQELQARLGALGAMVEAQAGASSVDPRVRVRLLGTPGE